MIMLPVLAALFAAATWMVGWWTVLVVALVTGALWRHAHAARRCALAATLAWVLLLTADAAGGRFSVVGSALGGVMRAPPLVLMLMTLLFAAAAAWSAAVIGSELARHAAGHSRRAGIAAREGAERMPPP